MTMQTTKRIMAAVALLAAAGVAAPGCGAPSGQSLCDDEADCELWSFGKVNSCYAEADTDDFVAGRTPCGGLLDDLRACENATGFCAADRDWHTNCGFERDRWHKCSGR